MGRLNIIDEEDDKASLVKTEGSNVSTSQKSSKDQPGKYSQDLGEFLLEINLKFLLSKIGARLNLNIDLISLHVGSEYLT